MELPASVTKIGGMAFYSCNSLKTVKILSNSSDFAGQGENIFTEIADESKIYVLSEDVKRGLLIPHTKASYVYNPDKTTIEIVTEEQMAEL